ncbi:MAG TPA: penicillin-binding transpeptidase domain-containing protein [Oscillospiraceae bacterium]|nr:penicillin-binding transpeptidase domain-containing protein [Oscillospiraceae bacterium]
MAKGTTVRMWHRTFMVLFALLVIGFGAILFSLVRWQLVDGATLQQHAVAQQLQNTTITAQRGTIYDCNMKVLAQSATVWTVVLEPVYITDDKTRDTVAEGLDPILGMDKNAILKLLKNNTKSYYTIVKRKVESDVKDKILDFKHKINMGNGIRLIEDYKRYYPYHDFAASVLGFTSVDNNGLAGLELQYNKELTGTAGKLVTAKNALGTDMPFQYEQKVDAQNGNNLVLSLDESIQHFLETNLEQGIVNNKVQNRATGIVMNVKTGEILAMATKGDFDPNDPREIADPKVKAEIDKLSGDAKTQAITTAQLTQWRNKAVSDTYYPGSVFKMVTGSAGLDSGVITEKTTFEDPGYAIVSGTRMDCWKPSGHGHETFVQGLCNSCNPFFMYIGGLLGPDRFFKYYSAFGFTQKTGIDLPGESNSLYYTAAQLNPVELATESFGQGDTITPIQMITACAAVANGGYLVQPHLVDQIVDSNGNIVKTIGTNVKRQVISTEVSKSMASIMQQNATIGTAKTGYLPGYRVAGKTGTSEKTQKNNETHTKSYYIASYCGFAPADDPQVAMLIFCDEPMGDSYYGSAVSGPIFSKTMEETLNYLGVEKKYTPAELAKVDTTAPSVVGNTLAQAQAAATAKSLKYKVYGKGTTVVKQVPDSGGSIPQGGTLILFTDENSISSTTDMPNLIGLSLTEANRVAAANNVNMKINGASAALNSGGSIKSSSQDIAAGTKVKPGTTVTVTFIDSAQHE